MRELEFRKLIGLKVVALRGMANNDKRVKKVPLTFVLFDDEKTFLRFTEQDNCASHE